MGERELFEQWIRDDDSEPRLDRCAEFPDQYEDVETERLWLCWQERASIAKAGAMLEARKK